MESGNIQNTTNKLPPKNKYDVEIAKIELETKKVDLKIEEQKANSKFWSDIISAIAKVTSVIGSVVSAILAWKGECKVTIPDSWMWIFLLATFGIVSIIAVFSLVAWRFERKGKKRAIEEKQKFQKIAEYSDAYRSSSCLTEQGDTPKER